MSAMEATSGKAFAPFPSSPSAKAPENLQVSFRIERMKRKRAALCLDDGACDEGAWLAKNVAALALISSAQSRGPLSPDRDA
jgi:hypothetical protein